MAKDKFYDNRKLPAVKKTFYIPGSTYDKLMKRAHLGRTSTSRQLVVILDSVLDQFEEK